jgi:hypothetical protein
MSIETVEEIKARWNEPVSNYGTERMIGDRVPEGDGRATVALGNPNSPDSPFSDRVDASLPKGVETLTPANGAVAGTDKYDTWSFGELKDEIDERNDKVQDEDNHISKGGSAEDLRARLREDDAQPEAPAED